MKTDHVKMLCDISELNTLFKESFSVDSFLQQAVEMVAKHTNADVCSIYLYDDLSEELTLRATQGLNKDIIGKVQLKKGEGITGLALKELRTIYVTEASKHPNFVHIPDSDEEPFENFLAIPITRGLSKIGVLNLQRRARKQFTHKDILACQGVASQLANIIENAKFLIDIHETKKEKKKTSPQEFPVIKGKVASEGFAVSFAKIYDKTRSFEILKKEKFEKTYTLEDFHRALKDTEQQLEALQERVEEKLDDAASLIFASHLMILKDDKFTGSMEEMIKQGKNPPDAVIDVVKRYINIFKNKSNKRTAEKVQDIEDLAVRIIGNLINKYETLSNYSSRIVIAREIFPSEMLAIASQDIAGLILVAGGVTSHLSILARSLKIPMIIAEETGLLDINDNTQVILDAEAGNIYVNPSNEVLSNFQEREKARLQLMQYSKKLKPETFTHDGHRVTLVSNINLLSDLDTALKMQSEGVGLYRTEFPFIIRNYFPTEEEQYRIYKKLADKMTGKPITFRTLDIGGDKIMSYYRDSTEQNPSMGMRSIRFSLLNTDIFEKQIKAILRAGFNEDIRIMFPMISSADEFLKVKEFVKECITDLQKEGVEHNSEPKLGIMVELPSVVYIMEELAEEADFFSIGTNDLIQFMLGVDRTNEKVAGFYIPHNPAVFRALAKIAEIARKKNRDVSVCGDIAHYEKYIPFLLGIGISTLSLNPTYIPKIKMFIEHMDMKTAREMANRILSLHSVEKINGVLENFEDYV